MESIGNPLKRLISSFLPQKALCASLAMSRTWRNAIYEVPQDRNEVVETRLLINWGRSTDNARPLGNPAVITAKAIRVIFPLESKLKSTIEARANGYDVAGFLWPVQIDAALGVAKLSNGKFVLDLATNGPLLYQTLELFLIGFTNQVRGLIDDILDMGGKLTDGPVSVPNSMAFSSFVAYAGDPAIQQKANQAGVTSGKKTVAKRQLPTQSTRVDTLPQPALSPVKLVAKLRAAGLDEEECLSSAPPS